MDTKILDIEFEHNSIGTTTLRKCFTQILTDVWVECEGFSGKRALGDSDWQNDIYVMLIKNGVIQGTIDEDGCAVIESVWKADNTIVELIKRALNGN